MRIDEIKVDGFGLLRDLRIEPAQGLTLIRGANEAGKSTLLAFIRAVLFGFETRGHPALAGGQRGGWLKVRAGDGRSVRIERYGLTGGAGRLRILDGEGEELGNEMLPRLLQGVEKTVFNNVFAFGLAELAQFGNLTGPEIAARIYGAGMGTGAMSVVDIENRLEQRRSALFTKQAQKPRMNVLLGEIDGLNDRIAALDVPASFKQAEARRAELEARLATLDDEARAVSAELRYLERLRDGWPSWLVLTAARARWADLAAAGQGDPADSADPIDALAGDLPERMSRSELELERISARTIELTEERRRLIAERDAQPVDTELLAARPEVERLLRAVPEIQADRNRIADREHERSDRNAALAEALRRLGPDWTEERLVRVDDSLAAQNAIAGPFRVSLETADREVGTAQGELANADLALSDARAELAAIDPRADNPAATEPAPSPAAGAPADRSKRVQWLVLAAGLAIATALGAIVLGLGLAQAILLGAVIGIALGAAGWLGQGPRTAGATAVPPNRDPEGARREERLGRVRSTEQRRQDVAARLAVAGAARDRAQAEWQTWLGEHGLARDLDREGAARVVEGVVRARAILAERQSIERRRDEAAARLDARESEAAALLDQLDRPAGDPLVELERLRRELEASLDGQAAHDRAARDLERIEASEAANGTSREAALAAQQAILAEAGADDPAGLRLVVARADQRNEVRREVRAAEDTLAALSGPGEALIAFEADLERYADVGRIASELAAAVERGRIVENERAATIEQLGAERDRMAELEHSAESATLRQARAERVAELEQLAQTWSATTIALELLRRTRSRYERDHRPEVLQTAETLLAQWSNGRYARILAPLGRQIEELERSDGVIVPISGLSTGTAEQLYLALRFGLVEHFAREAESLPLVMDDILVNFDPGRAERAARSIEDLATRHQVLYFTCHPNTPLSPAQTVDLPVTGVG